MAMKPKISFYLVLVFGGGLWIAFISSARFSNWLLERQQNPDRPAVIYTAAEGTWAKKLKTPWANTKVVLYRSNGQIVQLNAKQAVYTVWSTKGSTNQSKGFDCPVAVFIDPATKKVWAGEVDAGEVETNVYQNTDDTVSTNYLIYTNLYFETASGIFRGDNVINDGTFDWDESVIKQAQPGEELNALIDRVETNTGTAWPFDHIHGESQFEDYFPDDFFSGNTLGTQSIPIQRIEVANGKLRLYIDSLKYKTTAGVWLDLKTFEVRRTIEYRQVYFNLETFCRSVIPAIIAILTALETMLLTRKARGVAHCILSAVVLVCVIWSLVMLCRIFVFGAWPTHLPILRPVIALGDWAMYLPVIVIGVAVVFTLAQALLVRFEK